ncbi:hypothetical protein HYALB_00009888 [Hymenoscyphus albidus]|uniref:Trimethyllysine dioxygenase n=1 Tax=Hymenoscyphus albidus TaxID=595503 RepID=A0A9N9M164_9HELO|nr:hypothetical protein HYALB_00009888 [Hymenoscyphus albidus]
MNVRLRHLYSRWPCKATLTPRFTPLTTKRCHASGSREAAYPAPRPRRVVYTSKSALWSSPIHPILHCAYEENFEVPSSHKRFHDEEVARLPNTIPLWNAREVALELVGKEAYQTCIMPNIWLRENCLCNECINSDTLQRAVDTFSLPQDIQPSKVVIAKQGLQITWQDGHQSLHPWAWIENHKGLENNLNYRIIHRKEEDTRVYWGAEIADNPPSVHYDEIMASDVGVGVWTEKIRKYGFCYVDGCPVSPKKTEELLRRISFIRETHYGGFYDFTSDLTMKDTAYTSLALPAHTDTTYFSDPAGLQMFHLLSHTSGEGGTSLLVDGFKAAHILQQEDNIAYGFLRTFKLSAHASGNEGITITPSKEFTVIEGFRVANTRDLLRIRWNNDDRVTPRLSPATAGWYKAARKFNEILKRKDMEYWAQLEPGRPLIFDNWRVLHGRSAFTGTRRICGGYINHDDYISRWRNTNFTRSRILRHIL